MKLTDNELILGVLGLAIIEMHSIYVKHAPDLDAIRNSSPDNTAMTQHIVDADILTGSLVLFTAGLASYILKNWLPVAFGMMAFGFTSWYYHSVARSPAPWKEP